MTKLNKLNDWPKKNKLNGVETCLDGCEKWENYCVIFPKVKKYL